MAAVIITDRTTTVRNRCVMEVFGGIFMSHDVSLFSDGTGDFVL